MSEIDVSELVTELRRRVDERRLAGEYPPGLEEQLEAEFAHIMAATHRDEVGTAELARQIGAVRARVTGLSGVAEPASRIPGGSAVHETVGRLVGRHVGTLTESVRGLGVQVADALSEVHRLLDVMRAADERQLNDVVAAVFDRIAVIDHVAAVLGDLDRRVAALEASATDA